MRERACSSVFAAMATVLSLSGCMSERCEKKSLGLQFCIPDGGWVPANQPLTFEGVQQCGSGCGTTLTGCEVAIDGGSIVLVAGANVCAPPSACTLACAITRLNCSIPPLPAGTYTVSSADGTAPPQQLQAGTSGQTGCVILGVP